MGVIESNRFRAAAWLRRGNLFTMAFFCMVAGQVFNNQYASFADVLSVGKVLTMVFMGVGFVDLLRQGNVRMLKGSNSVMLLLWLYLSFAILGSFSALEAHLSIKHLFTVSVQVALPIMVLLTWKRNWSGTALIALASVAVMLGVANVLNATVPGANFFLVRESVGRILATEGFLAGRVVSFTNIYGQFGYFLLIGGMASLDWAGFRTNSWPSGVILFLACFGLIVCAVISTQSRSIYCAFAVSIYTYLLLKSQRSLALILLAVSVIFLIRFGTDIYNALVAIHASTVYGRLLNMEIAIDLIRSHPFGIGQGGFQKISGSAAVLHNTFLDAFMIGGIGGGIVFFILALYPLGVLLPHRNSRIMPVDGFIAGYCGGLFVMNFYTGITEYQYFLMPAIALGLASYVRGEVQKREGRM